MSEARWRAFALIVAAAYAASRGMAYVPLGDVPSALPGGLDLISTYVPLTAWAIAWLVVVASFVAATAAVRVERFAWAGLVGMLLVWAGAYVFGYAFSLAAGEPSREWLNAGSYGFPALLLLALTRAPRPARE